MPASTGRSTSKNKRKKDTLWIREEFLTYDQPFEKFVVHGHTPVPSIDTSFESGQYRHWRICHGTPVMHRDRRCKHCTVDGCPRLDGAGGGIALRIPTPSSRRHSQRLIMPSVRKKLNRQLLTLARPVKSSARYRCRAIRRTQEPENPSENANCPRSTLLECALGLILQRLDQIGKRGSPGVLMKTSTGMPGTSLAAPSFSSSSA